MEHSAKRTVKKTVPSAIRVTPLPDQLDQAFKRAFRICAPAATVLLKEEAVVPLAQPTVSKIAQVAMKDILLLVKECRLASQTSAPRRVFHRG
jgi:hypothetical protein